MERRRVERPEIVWVSPAGHTVRFVSEHPIEYLFGTFTVPIGKDDSKMSKQHRQAADQALVMDAPRIIRKDMTALTEMVAKYQGLEGALNGVGQEAAAEEVSDLVVPLVNARAALEHVMERLNEGGAPSLPGIEAEQSEAATQAAFDLEDAIMAFINDHGRMPAEVFIRQDLYDLIQQAWPGKESVQLQGGSIKLSTASEKQGDAPFAFRLAED